MRRTPLAAPPASVGQVPAPSLSQMPMSGHGPHCLSCTYTYIYINTDGTHMYIHIYILRQSTLVATIGTKGAPAVVPDMGRSPEPYLSGHQAGCVVRGGVLHHCFLLGRLLHHLRICGQNRRPRQCPGASAVSAQGSGREANSFPGEATKERGEKQAPTRGEEPHGGTALPAERGHNPPQLGRARRDPQCRLHTGPNPHRESSFSSSPLGQRQPYPAQRCPAAAKTSTALPQ